MKKPAFICSIITSLTLVISSVIIIVNTDYINRSKAMPVYMITEIGDLRETLPTKGVVIPANLYSIYYDRMLGSIKEVKVKEGSAVSNGDALIEYNTTHIDDEISSLEQQLDRLTILSSKLEDDIADLEQEQLDTSVDLEDQTIAQNDKIISSQIREKEYQKQDIDMQIDQIDQKIKQLESVKENYVVKSKMDGIVTKVNPFTQSEKEPIVSIESNQPYLIEGKLSENDIIKVQEGQKAIVSAAVLPRQKNEGLVKELKMTPIGKPSVEEKESFYPFLIEMAGAVDNWRHGYHVNVDIVLEERNDVVVVPDNVIQQKDDKSYAYVLRNGILEKRKIQLGMKINHRQEVAEGLLEGERIISKPSEELRDKMGITMPINELYLKKESIESFTNDQTIRLLLKGLFD
ncbi:efflux RND transporter periplasmic adaptor subunit [Neobacillus kokaensis]|uniref:RND transporter n=1 Tax=Neobacillus kokaensis TaxID=2759023 RepID=A0ABQ3N4L4_9BACI|nr:biotin/lipoyl-binding protein [Neobacillus kokaensis]GHH99594.1 RND transporter [Neobacillus kokaensis]